MPPFHHMVEDPAPWLSLFGYEGNLKDATMAADGAYAREHPGLKTFVRPYVPGEFSFAGSPEVELPSVDDAGHPYGVLVTVLGPGVRIKRHVELFWNVRQIGRGRA